ncbi:hypothetical protein OMP38_25440 [Cohnella ginsengisoli]|uniref:Uncharacterized protein n=1 Tax=Cohnella ginsengisoli TaxID=425004 RepID=A0A9X4KKK9_9BACL|nr:hypothetical protein [Cohnella ginsengisoli]MDG0793793.1 hypothetical protein [Cohnella ginsengisoli]
MTELTIIFEAVWASGIKIERAVGEAENPLAQLCLTVLREQKQQIERMLPKLADEKAALSEFKQEISIVYHDDELIDSYFRSWLRHLKWSDDPFQAEAERLLAVLADMKSRLKQAAGLLEELNGYDAVKYVIPSFYLPILR